MLRKRSKLMLYYMGNTIKSIIGLNQNNKYKLFFEEKKPIDPLIIPKYKNQLEKPYVYYPMLIKSQYRMNKGEKIKKEHLYFIDICEFKQQILPEGFPETTVWGFGGLIMESKSGRVRYLRSSPGATFEAIRGVPVHVKWRSKINIPVRIALHGGEVASKKDKVHEKKSYTEIFQIYHNKQEPSAYWYHGQDMDGSNSWCTYFGLSGFYLLRESKDKQVDVFAGLDIPGQKYEYPIIIQDRSFYNDGSFAFSEKNINELKSKSHNISKTQLLGNTIVVNGKVWPNLDVERRQYRFYILNGSISRFYNLKLSNDMKFTLIGGDRGLLPSPLILDSLLLGPGERADILIDFSRVNPGSKIILLNNAKAPYPDGQLPDSETTGQIMRFTVPEHEAMSITPIKLPEKIKELPPIESDLPKRFYTIYEKIEEGESILYVNDQDMDLPITISAQIDSSEEWCILNLTDRAYPIHLKAVKFQILNRQKIDKNSLLTSRLNMKDISLDNISSYLIGDKIEPAVYEIGWKDTVRVDPDMVTRIAIKLDEE